MGDPLSITTGALALVALSIKLVVAAVGMVDKTIAAYSEAANELTCLQQDLEQLQRGMKNIHGKLHFLASNTKDRRFKRLLRNQHGQVAVQELCSALDETFQILSQLTDQAESETATLQSIALPSNENSLAFVHAILKHSFSPGKVSDVVVKLRAMQAEIRTCDGKLEATFKHVYDLYDLIDRQLTRVPTSTSNFSSSTTLTLRVKLVDWLKRREDKWALSNQTGFSTVQLRDFLQADLAKNDPDEPVNATGISLIPFEVLGKIFHHLCLDGPLPLRHLLRVSKSFHNAAINNRDLWTIISFEAPFFTHFLTRANAHSASFLLQCLRRSGSLPLHLRINHNPGVAGVVDTDAYINSVRNSLLDLFRIIQNTKLNGFERCISLVWQEPGYTFQQIISLLPPQLPVLRYMKLSGFKANQTKPLFPICPALDNVDLSVSSDYLANYDYIPLAVLRKNFSYVTTLSFGKDGFWDNCDIIALSLFPNLRHLVLYNDSVLAGHFKGQPHSVAFHTLSSFRIRGRVPQEVLNKLVLLALDELHIEADEHGKITYVAPPGPYDIPCSRFYMLLPDIVSTVEPQWAARLRTVVSKCSRVETLYISKWMEEAFQTFEPLSNVNIYIL